MMRLYKGAGHTSGLGQKLKELFGEHVRWMSAWSVVKRVLWMVCPKGHPLEKKLTAYYAVLHFNIQYYFSLNNKVGLLLC